MQELCCQLFGDPSDSISKQNYPRGRYIFWPDKATSHQARMTTEFLNTKGVRYVKKEDNLTEVLQYRPIEDFFGLFATCVYEGNGVAKNQKA